MQTHEDNNHLQTGFMDRLRERAESMVENKESEITAGKEGEVELASWRHKRWHIRHMPDDEQGILRISLGGGETPLPMNYLVFRGPVGRCITLLEGALAAIKKAP
jgi:hypothetical protein